MNEDRSQNEHGAHQAWGHVHVEAGHEAPGETFSDK